LQSILGERIAELRNRRGLTQTQLAEKIGMSHSTVASWEKGKRDPGTSMIAKLAVFFGVSTDYLLGRDNNTRDLDTVREAITLYGPSDMAPVGELTYLPIVAEISCGLPLYTEDNVAGYFPVDQTMVNTQSGQYIWLRAKGDSMTGANIHDGSLVLIRVQPEVEDGDIAVVCLDDETATLKRVYSQDDLLMLLPENPDMRPMSYPKQRVRIVGKAVQALTYL